MRAVASPSLLLAVACSRAVEPAPYLDRDALLDPTSCQGCHQDQHREWSGSMHAYASVDPVFRAMNARGQRETGGALGEFCVQCHAPVALREGATFDGLNLPEVPSALQGVTCWYCHSVDSVTTLHNAGLRLADDGVLRGPFADPVPNAAHRAAADPHFDARRPESSALCGACHDVVTPAGVFLERTYAEWGESVFARPEETLALGCNECHMPSRSAPAARDPGAPVRRVRAHAFPAVDVALTPFPERDAQRALVERELDSTLRAELCVVELPGASTVEVLLENVGAGHRFPSGAAHDRRLFVELRAEREGRVVYESGVVRDDEAVARLSDPDLWLMRDRVLDAEGREVHHFWEVRRVEPLTIPAPVTLDPRDPDYLVTHVSRRYPRLGSVPGTLPEVPDRVTLRVRLRPFGREILEDLVASGDLAAEVLAELPTFDLLPRRGRSPYTLEWTPTLADDPVFGFRREVGGMAARCVRTGSSRVR